MKLMKLLLIIIIGLLSTVPCRIYAQQSSQVSYLDSIIEDEEGANLNFPSFVFAEPVKKEIYVIDSKARIIIYTSDFFPLFTLDKNDGIDVAQAVNVDPE